MGSPIIEAQFSSVDGAHAVVIEDDGRVAYAYLLDADGKICGDVWLYNRGPAPKEPEWTDREKAPFANPEAFIAPAAELSPPTSADGFSVEWRRAESTSGRGVVGRSPEKPNEYPRFAWCVEKR